MPNRVPAASLSRPSHPTRPTRPACPTLVLALLLSGCAVPAVEMTDLPARIDYVCANQRVLPVARHPAQGVAAVRIDDEEILLRRQVSAAQEKYGNGDLTLYLEGERAMLERNGQVLFGPCTSPVPLPTYYRQP